MLDKFIPLASPDIQQQDIDAVVNVLQSGMLVQGENVLALEEKFAKFHNVNNAIAVSNGTATMHLALVALGIGKGDEVIIPAFSYIATANVVELVGANCIFVDIDDSTFTIDITKIESAITPKTKAIIPVHEFGLAANITAINALAAKHNIFVIEDAACALGAKQYNKPVGSFGVFSSFSLHPRKSITSGEGGIVLTNDNALAAKISVLRNHGIEMQQGKMNFIDAGYNYRMTDFQGALASSQMDRIEKIIEYKQTLSEVYFNEINNKNVGLPFTPPERNHTWQTFHILLQEDKDQQETITFLKEKNIGANYGAQCIPYMTYYYQKYGYDAKVLFPNAYKAYTKGVAIPIYEKLTREIISKIAKTINLI